jgi:hypothetical protein
VTRHSSLFLLKTGLLHRGYGSPIGKVG